MENIKIRLAGVKDDSLIDGPGLRFVVFFQGCPFACPGCHNPDTWDKDGGYTSSTSDVQKLWQNNFLLDGITFSGGEPFKQPEALLNLIVRAKKDNLNVTIYTGFTYETLVAKNDPTINEILMRADFLIDGPFIVAEKAEVLYRGSKNQRIINLKKSLQSNKVTLIREYRDFNV
ncbi:MAG TPA: 4Fe-4S single cluster domain-containing protein [Bacilli bacterium]|nr:4Fe-4S single cluster domain-containing protein [Bacilli bacterium]